jgi:hypothetical protein
VLDDLQKLNLSELATKSDLKNLRYQLTWNLFGLLMAQGALVIAILQLLQ